MVDPFLFFLEEVKNYSHDFLFIITDTIFSQSVALLYGLT